MLFDFGGSSCSGIRIIAEYRSPLDQIDYAALSFGINVDIPLRRPEAVVTGESLDVPKRSSHQRYFSCGIGDEGPATAVARTVL